jgi:hypothetical protein
LNFKFLLVLNHDEEAWDYPKEEVREDNLYIHIFKGGVVGAIGTCSKKP